MCHTKHETATFAKPLLQAALLSFVVEVNLIMISYIVEKMLENDLSFKIGVVNLHTKVSVGKWKN